ncbi:sugar phosphate isomerase/epimerase family protein [Cohnella nanjingensis]|uniref:Sugar phosphate isomerase/epimerase n=1 Tax=Cohnella nanjingensis TaxID=1387779 RepID=A0A7X0RXT8_9BACL|nr:sugar phosphate isomerase/epimerase [Cohnella nanjingensis]MBB6675632.1 sugar phosphate isomerase/epimerase [Cohnella nanjingensis]
MDRSSIAAQLYTVRDYTQNEEDLQNTFRNLRNIGYEAVQVSAIGPIGPGKVKALADEFSLRICATHVPYARLVEELEDVVATHRLWGCDYVGVGALPESYREGEAGYAAFAREAGEIAKRLQEQGLTFIYHNHRFEFERFAGGRTGLDILFQETDPESFGFELDLFWVQAGGANPIDWIRRVKGRMDVVHLKDMAIVRDRAVTAEIGEGNLDHDAIVAACRETGVKWYVVEQDECRRDPFESLAISYRYLKRYL